MEFPGMSDNEKQKELERALAKQLEFDMDDDWDKWEDDATDDFLNAGEALDEEKLRETKKDFLEIEAKSKELDKRYERERLEGLATAKLLQVEEQKLAAIREKREQIRIQIEAERRELERQAQEATEHIRVAREIEASMKKEQAVKDEEAKLQQELDELAGLKREKGMREEEARIAQEQQFILEEKEKIQKEIERKQKEIEEAKRAQEEAEADLIRREARLQKRQKEQEELDAKRSQQFKLEQSHLERQKSLLASQARLERISFLEDSQIERQTERPKRVAIADDDDEPEEDLFAIQPERKPEMDAPSPTPRTEEPVVTVEKPAQPAVNPNPVTKKINYYAKSLEEARAAAAANPKPVEPETEEEELFEFVDDSQAESDDILNKKGISSESDEYNTLNQLNDILVVDDKERIDWHVSPMRSALQSRELQLESTHSEELFVELVYNSKRKSGIASPGQKKRKSFKPKLF